MDKTLEIFCNSPVFGGAERFSQILADNLNARVITTEQNKNNFGTSSFVLDIGAKISKKSFDFYRFPLYRKRIKNILTNDSVLFTQFKKEQIICSHPHFSFYPRFTFEHGPLNPWMRIHPLLWVQFKRAMRNYDKRFCGSLVVKKELEDKLNLPYVHVPYGIECDSLIESLTRENYRNELGVSPGEIVITFADKPTPDRGMEDLLKVLQKTKFPFTFWIFGSEERTLVTKNKIKFWGFQKNLNHFLQLSDYFLNLSTAHGEAFPLRILQAMMSGCGIISCEGGFRQEMEVQPWTGVLPRVRGFRLQNELSNMLSKIKEPLKQERRLLQNKMIQEQFSADNFVRKISQEMGIG